MTGQVQGAAPKADLFDAYFRRADSDRDGRISGDEAVSFFQGSNLPKNVLAQIWNYADRNRTGHLGRAEFYDALRLVTVAQSKRELTPDIVKAALYSPASAKIPAPQINLPVSQTPQTHVVGLTAPSQLVSTTPSSQSPGPRTMSTQYASMGQQYNISSASQSVRQSPSGPLGTVRPMPSTTSQGFSGPGSTFGSNLSTAGAQMGSNGKTSVALTQMASQVSDRRSIPSTMQAGSGSGLVGSVGSLSIRPPVPSGILPSIPVSMEQEEPALRNGFASFSGNVLAGTPSQIKMDNSLPSSLSSSVPVSSGRVPGSGGPRSSVNHGSLDSLPRTYTAQQVGGQPLRVQPNQPVSVQSPLSEPVLRPPIPAPIQSHQQWPKMTHSDVQKYTKVFVEVDTDKDGKITGEQARNLFLSWRLPREVLKQVWDLSDQDNDSMLSLREFCIALYLMERYREGRPLPSVLPNNIIHDMHPITHPAGERGHASWGYSPGSQGTMHASSARHVPRPPGRPPLPTPSAHADERLNSKQQKLKVPVLDKHLVDQLSEEEQKNLNSKFKEATEANKKVEELEKEIKESKEKIDFCRTKMQELVIYKSRYDNRLNEITARATADKREVEMLAAKYEEKYREKGDVASKLTLEESTFRDIQERKMELYRVIVKLEPDGGSGEKFKGHVDQIQSNLEELVKSLSQRCKNYGLRGKPTTVLELPFGWQPGIQEGAADWDESWDKFEDEGFTFVKDLTLDVQNVIAPPKTRTKTALREKTFNDESGKANAASDAEAQVNPESVLEENVDPEDKAEAPNVKAKHATENGSAHEENEAASAKSPVGSPTSRSPPEIPQNRFKENHFEQVVSGSSPRAKVTSDHRGFSEPGWGSFDKKDNNESVWGSTTVSTSKDNDDLFGPGGFNLNPIKTGSLFGGDNVNKGSSVFADSVPSTPLFPPCYSPRTSNEVSEYHNGLTFSRFDSFRSTESGLQSSGTLARFDSMRSSKDFDHEGGFPSFDDSDPFGSSPFRSSLETETPRSEVDPFGGSSSLRLSLGSETPRSEVDPFGAGSFRSTFVTETPRRDSDPFGPSLFRSSFDSETPRIDSDSFGAGPFRTAFGSETPRAQMDSFGAGPFKSNFGSETPKGETDSSGAVPFASSFGSETPRSEYEGFGSKSPFTSSFGSETPRSDWIGAGTPRDSFGYGAPFRSSVGSETTRSEMDPFGSSGPFRSSLGDETPRMDSDPFGGSGPFKLSFVNESPRGTNNWNAF